MLIMLTVDINMFLVGEILKFRKLFKDVFKVQTVLKLNFFIKNEIEKWHLKFGFMFSVKNYKTFYLQILSFAQEVGSKIHTSCRSD